MSAADPVLIIGAGPIGLSAALRLASQGHAVRILDARRADAVHQDTRVLALSHGSRQLLETLDAWPAASATPIHTIHISQRGALGRTELGHAEYGLPALGYVLPASALIASLNKRIASQGLSIEFDARVENLAATPKHITLTLRNTANESSHAQGALAVCCEGKIETQDEIISRDYDQHALLLRVTPMQPHANLARERFTPDGPIALLPLGSDYAVVWTVSPTQLAELKTLSDEALLVRLHSAFGGNVRLSNLRERSSYPLGLRVRRTTVGERTVWLGNAAQTLHPVAGQGFNLGLRDVWELAESLRGQTDVGAAEALNHYARSRRADRWGTAGFTHSLVSLFSNDNPVLSHARGAGLLALDIFPPLRHFVAKRMIFGARAWP